MTATKILLPVLLVAAIGGCRNQRATYMASERSFHDAVAFVNDQIEAGSLSKARAKRLAPAVNSGNAALKSWLDTLLSTPEGEQPDVKQSVINAVLDALDVLEAYFLSERK